VVFRTDDSDEERWEPFVERWDVLMSTPMESTGLETGLDRLVDKACMKIIDDEVMSGRASNEVVLYVCSLSRFPFCHYYTDFFVFHPAPP